MKSYTNPYEQGKKDYQLGKKSANPYPEYGGKWCQYNLGYNSQWMKIYDKQSTQPRK